MLPLFIVLMLRCSQNLCLIVDDEIGSSHSNSSTLIKHDSSVKESQSKVSTYPDKEQRTAALSRHQGSTHECALVKDPMTSSINTSLLQSFRVSGAQLCWEFCSHVWECQVFSFNFNTRRCYLFSSDTRQLTEEDDAIGPTMSPIKPLVSYSMSCLECPSSVESLLTGNDVLLGQSEPILIIDRKHGSRCLTTSRNKAGDGLFSVHWTHCAKATFWILSRLNYAHFGSERIVIQVLLKSHPEWALRWHEQPLNGSFLSLSRAEMVTTDPNECCFFPLSGLAFQTFIIFKNDKLCSFTLNKLSFKTKWEPWITDFNETADPFPLANMSDLRLWRQPSSRTRPCFLHDLSVAHGKVYNPDRVPFFLRGSQVRVRCDPGYGVAPLNYTSIQVVICSEETVVRSCTSLTNTTVSVGVTSSASITSPATVRSVSVTSVGILGPSEDSANGAAYHTFISASLRILIFAEYCYRVHS